MAASASTRTKVGWKYLFASGVAIVFLVAPLDHAAAQWVVFDRSAVGISGAVTGYNPGWRYRAGGDYRPAWGWGYRSSWGYRRAWGWGAAAISAGVANGYYAYASGGGYYPYYAPRYYYDCAWQWRLAPTSIGTQWVMARAC